MDIKNRKISNICVLDLTHGGEIISGKLASSGRSVTAVDVYGTQTSAEMEELERSGINAVRETPEVTCFDLVVAPVHLDPGYPALKNARESGIPVLTHHEIVGKIIVEQYDFSQKMVIEVTGTKAKTSTALLLSRMLSGKKLVTHTSKGLEYHTGEGGKSTILKMGLSITPASIIAAIDTVKSAGLDPDIFIFEISLGGTGIADIGIITTLMRDYGIANNTAKASEAKRQMILNAKQGSLIVVNYDALRYFGACRRDIGLVSFSDSINAAANVYYEYLYEYQDKSNSSNSGATIAYRIDSYGKSGKFTFFANREYEMLSYKTAIVSATAAALCAGAEEIDIIKALSEFSGISGRMKKMKSDGWTIIDNSNSGMDIASAGAALDYAASFGKVTLVFGEEARQVCEGLNPDDALRFLEENISRINRLILVGERIHAISSRIKDNLNNDMNNTILSNSLTEGLSAARKITDKRNVILSCVKSFR